jgi:hypothetical protein
MNGEEMRGWMHSFGDDKTANKHAAGFLAAAACRGGTNEVT